MAAASVLDVAGMVLVPDSSVLDNAAFRRMADTKNEFLLRYGVDLVGNTLERDGDQAAEWFARGFSAGFLLHDMLFQKQGRPTVVVAESTIREAEQQARARRVERILAAEHLSEEAIVARIMRKVIKTNEELGMSLQHLLEIIGENPRFARLDDALRAAFASGLIEVNKLFMMQSAPSADRA